MAPAVLGFFAGLGLPEIIVILVVALIIFGNRLPEVARSLGKGYMEFRKGLRTLEKEIEFSDADIEIHDRKTAEKPADPGPAQPAPVDPQAGSPPPGGILEEESQPKGPQQAKEIEEHHENL